MQIQHAHSLINSNTRPVIFIGSSYSMLELVEVCEYFNIKVHGIIDQDYYGNTQALDGIPVIDAESAFDDPERAQYYRENFNFFCATNWTPIKNPVHTRNREKRMRQIDLIDQHELSTISLIHHKADVSKYSTVGKGVYIDAFASIEPGVTIEDFVNIYSHCIVGHHATLKRNSVFQRRTSLASGCTYGRNVYFGLLAVHFKTDVTVADGTFIQQGVCFARATVENEVVEFNGGNTRRVYNLRDNIQ